MKAITSCLLAVTLGCGADPVSYSEPVAINLKAESGAVNGTVLADEKGITTESGNPYGSFVAGARTMIGRDPNRIEIDRVTLTLGAQSTGVTALDQVYTGTVDVMFLMNDSNNTYGVGSVTSPTGPGPVPLDVTFASATVGDQDWSKFLGGSFKVVIRGTAAPEFANKGAKADLQLVFTFAAFE
jgi:hypothetical protein